MGGEFDHMRRVLRRKHVHHRDFLLCLIRGIGRGKKHGVETGNPGRQRGHVSDVAHNRGDACRAQLARTSFPTRYAMNVVALCHQQLSQGRADISGSRE